MYDKCLDYTSYFVVHQALQREHKSVYTDPCEEWFGNVEFGLESLPVRDPTACTSTYTKPAKHTNYAFDLMGCQALQRRGLWE